MIEFMIFIFGLTIGSFLNVCIYRMPKKESIVLPRSHCTHCNKTIPWYDNVPLLSFILLKGKCRFCKKPISFRYFFIELLTALLLLFTFSQFGLSYAFVIYGALICSLIVMSFIDLQIQEIPDEITLPGIVIGLALGFVFPGLMRQHTHINGLIYSLLGMLAGGGIVYLTGVLGKIAFKKDAMGGGDVKLMAMLGAFLGWELIILTFFLAPFSGSVIGIIEKLRNKASIIPYGPHLSLAAVIAIFWGREILNKILFY